MPLTFGCGMSVSRSTPITELIVLMSETASAPPRTAARPGGVMLVTFGVSLTITGKRVASFTHSVTMQVYSGTCPIAAPMPRSLMPCGQPKFSSTPSAPVSSTCFAISCHASRFDSTIREIINACFGYLRLHSLISLRLTSRGRSVMSSMLLRPSMRCGP
jgi:hypothetical protein